MDIVGILALICFVNGGMRLLVTRRERWLARRTRATLTTRIADANGHGMVEVRGTFRRGSDEQAEDRIAPFTGKPALWWHVEILTSHTSNDSVTNTTYYEETSREPLWIDDGSGQLARVDTEGAQMEVVEANISPQPPDARSFCAANNVPWNDRYSYRVQAICEGESAYVMGWSRREAGRPRPDAYRDEPTTQLVLSGPDSKGKWQEREKVWLIANREKDALVKMLTTDSRVGNVFLALAVILGSVWGYLRFALY